jgi:Flp pilus assembly protein CpaB
MSRLLPLVILFLAVVLCTTPARLSAEDPVLAKGTRAFACKLSKDQKVPDGVLPGTAVDVVAEVSEPLKTGVALLNVRVLAVDTKVEGNQTVTVQVTPTQAKVLALMQEDRAALSIKPHMKEERQR